MGIARTATWVTLPVRWVSVGTACSRVPAAMLMGRFGRKPGFLFAACYACAAALVAAWAISMENFWLFCFATFLVGSHHAFVQQYRFAVAESVPAERVGPSLSILMVAGVAAAWMGPETAKRLHDWLPWGEFAGSFVGLSLFMAGVFVLLCFYPGGRGETVVHEEPERPLSAIVLQPLFMLAVGAAVAGYAVMSFVMTATPVSMHTVDHFSLDDTTWVIQSHIIAMYLPSLFSGFLIARFGPRNIIAAGLVLLAICLAVAFSDRQLMNYWWALVLLGVGWNFLFLGGTTLLTQTHRPSERFKAQAVNDFMIFGLQAIAALSSGLILHSLGWQGIVGLSVPWLLLLLVILWMAGPRPVEVGV
ncbi:MAG: MFS transporter [Pseudomonadales bacterium]|nr:MFS transporter [Pseudomonadales bacterium]